MKKIVITAAALAALALAGCASTGATHAQTSATPRATASTTSAAPAAATPKPDGTFRGSCDYTLSTSLSSSDAGTLIGEIDLKNTGNVGNVVRARITWPQEGYPPVVATKTVRVPFGKSRTVQFHVTATQGNIELLQSWQDSHGFNDGCHFRGTLVRTFGPAH